MSDDPTEEPDVSSPRLPTGDYEVMVVDVEQVVDQVGDRSKDTNAELSLVIVKGPLKGQVVGLGYPGAADELLRLLGAHGTLIATDRGLRLRLED